MSPYFKDFKAAPGLNTRCEDPLLSMQFFLLTGFIFILPFDSGGTIREILFYSIMAVFMIREIKNRSYISFTLLRKDKVLNILIILSIIWGFASLANAIEPDYSLKAFSNATIKLYFFYFIIFITVYEFSLKQIRWILVSIAASAIIMAVYACYQFYQSPLILLNRVDGFTGAFYRLATLLTLAFPIVVVLALSFKGWRKYVLFSTIPVLIAAVFFTFTRAAWLALLVEILLFIILFAGNRKTVLSVILIGSFLLLFGLAYKSVVPSELIVHGSEGTRVAALKLSVEIVKKNPIAGIGYGKQVFSKYYPDIKDPLHAHNIFLNKAVEMGLVGFLFFVTIMGIVVKKFAGALKMNTDPQRKLYLSGIFVVILGYLFLNMFDYMYYGWPGQMFWMLLGIGNALIFSSSLSDPAASGLEKSHPEELN
jgi:O-antigen ligase